MGGMRTGESGRTGAFRDSPTRRALEPPEDGGSLTGVGLFVLLGVLGAWAAAEALVAVLFVAAGLAAVLGFVALFTGAALAFGFVTLAGGLVGLPSSLSTNLSISSDPLPPYSEPEEMPSESV